VEDVLLERADIVFTGGGALQDATVGRRPDAHCYASGIDLEHFGRARDSTVPVAPEIADLPHPILGYFGAIDERLDYDLIRAVCRARRDWSVVLLGPLIPGTVITVEEPNFHWLGAKPYSELPSHLRGFDVCIMPWVKSELTAHISPTKTPEYLAGGKPVVSVKVLDVERDYGDVVLFGDTPEEFVAATERALTERDRDWAATLDGREAVRTWEQIAAEMDDLIASLDR
jgi:UDP-galactopyranose mutase